MNRQEGKIIRVLGATMLSFALLILSLFIIPGLDSAPLSSVPVTIVSDLRTLKAASMFFFFNSMDELVHWTALPKGVSSMDAVGKYLAQYTDYSAIYTKPGHPYRLEITSDDRGVLWRVGCLIPAYLRSKDASYVSSIKERLRGRAERVGLLNADGTPYSGGETVYMAVSFDMGP